LRSNRPTFGGSGHLVVWGIRWQVGGGHTGGGFGGFQRFHVARSHRPPAYRRSPHHRAHQASRPGDIVFNFTFDDPKAYTKPWDGQLAFKLKTDGIMTETIYTISDELNFRAALPERNLLFQSGRVLTPARCAVPSTRKLTGTFLLEVSLLSAPRSYWRAYSWTTSAEIQLKLLAHENSVHPRSCRWFRS